jgi:TonB family protein
LGATRLEGIDPEFTYDYYLDRMLASIGAQWIRPPTEGEIRAVLRFTVERSGEITELQVVESSAYPAFDLAALRAVQYASPLPHLPASYRRDSLSVTLIVR